MGTELYTFSTGSIATSQKSALDSLDIWICPDSILHRLFLFAELEE